MALLEILSFPDPRLRRPARPVEAVGEALHRTVEDMFETIVRGPAASGWRLTQVNILQQIAVIDVSEERNEPRCLINPRIVEREGEESRQEGCLSVPGVFANVLRAERIRVEGPRPGGPARDAGRGRPAGHLHPA